MENAILVLIMAVLVLLGVRGSVKHFRGEGGCCGGGGERGFYGALHGETLIHGGPIYSR